jgi:putative aldouronate transport system substrate-binding protein
MFMRIPRILLLSAVLLVLIGSFPVFAGGGQQKTVTGAVDESSLFNPKGQLPLLKEKITLTMGMVTDNTTTDYINNTRTKALEKDSNIHLDFVWYGSDMAQKVEIQMMAGGTDLPDVLMYGIGTSAAGVYGSQGLLVPLNNYIENSAYWMNQPIKEMPIDPWKYIRSPDGNIYSLFRWNDETGTDTYSRMYINTAWLKEAGLSEPKSTAEFENMLRAFKNRPPNADGRKAYPFIDNRNNVRAARFMSALIGPFVYLAQGNNWFYRDPTGNISPVFTTDGWRQALTWIRGMVDEGLIDPLSFTQDSAQMNSIAGGTTGYPFGASTTYPLNFIPADDPRAETWTLMGPLAGPNGGTPVATHGPIMPQPGYFITKNCKYPEAAFRLGDLMMSEKHSVISMWGEEGVDWSKPAPTAKSYFEGVTPYLILNWAGWGTPNTIIWNENIGPQILLSRMQDGTRIQGVTTGLYLWITELAIKSRPYKNSDQLIGNIVYTTQESERVEEIKANVESYFLECYTRFILRDMSLENDWNTYLAELKNMGLDTYVQTARTAFERMNK